SQKGKVVVTGNGRVSLYLGSATGPSTTPAWVTVGAPNEVYGWALGSAGDVNGDGISDFYVSDNQADVKIKSGGMNKPTGINRGKVFVFHGSAAGPSTNASWTVTGDSDDLWLGESVVAGDFNHDGFSDLAIAARKNASPNPQTGRFYAYLGGSAG